VAQAGLWSQDEDYQLQNFAEDASKEFHSNLDTEQKQEKARQMKMTLTIYLFGSIHI
jgi:hypothetical protein